MLLGRTSQSRAPARAWTVASVSNPNHPFCIFLHLFLEELSLPGQDHFKERDMRMNREKAEFIIFEFKQVMQLPHKVYPLQNSSIRSDQNSFRLSSLPNAPGLLLLGLSLPRCMKESHQRFFFNFDMLILKCSSDNCMLVCKKVFVDHLRM